MPDSGWDRVIGYARSWGLSWEALRLYLTLSYVGLMYAGILPQPITSGRRSRQKQQELLYRWQQGDPTVRVRPADNSHHLTGDAFDLGSTSEESLAIYGSIVAYYGGRISRWGGDFRPPDTIHFDTGGF